MAGFLAGMACLAAGAEEPVWHRQIWVPSSELEMVLSKLSKAVLLTPGEYESLVREAAKGNGTPEAPAPRDAILRSLEMTGELIDSVLALTAVYEWENLAGGKVIAPLPVPHPALAALPAGESAVEVRAQGDGTSGPVVVLRGRGKHRVEARFQLPVTRPAEGFEVRLDPLPVASASLRMRFDEGVAVSANAPVVAEKGGEHLFGMPSPGEGLLIRWRRTGSDAMAPVAVRQTCRNLYFLDGSGLQADLGLILTAELSKLPGELRFRLPAQSQVVDVSGGSVSHWNAAEGMLTVSLTPGFAGPVALRVLLERPTLVEGADTASFDLPMLRAEVATRVEGRVSLFGGPGVRVEGIGVPRWFLPAAAGAALENDPACLAVMEFPVLEGKGPEVRLRRFASRVHAGVDSLVSVEPDAVRLRHDLLLETRAGEIFASRILLGTGERVEDVEVTGNERASWIRTGNEIRLDWGNGLAVGRQGRVRIRTRLEPAVWDQGKESARILFTGVRVDADTQDGYFGVTVSPDCEVSVRREEGLQARDPRRTPVTGQLAWQRTGASTLELEIGRLRPAYDVHLTAFVVPDAKKVEIEGQIDLAIRHSAVRELPFGFAPELAGLVRFSSPLIAGQWADLAKGIVTVRFHHELTGFQQLRWRMTLPVSPTQEGNEIRFAVALPRIDAPSAARLTGQWMIQAMNDTSLTVQSSQAKEFDSLRVPAINGYTPAYRVVSALDHRGADHGIVIQGLQHVNRPVLGLVVRQLAIDTSISAEGREIHDATILLDNRAAGELLLGVPANGQITSLTVDGVSQRPVLAESQPANRIRVALPRNGEIPVRLSYIQGGLPWEKSGEATTVPIRLDPNVPVEKTQWRVHLSAGYQYEHFSGGLRPSFPEDSGILLPLLWSRAVPVLEKTLGWSGPELAKDAAEPVTGSGPDDNRGLGTTFLFKAPQAPADLTFRYTRSEEAIRFAWAWILGGMVAFWVFASQRPVVVGLTGVALLTFIPLAGLTDLLSVANGLLAGWLVMLIGTQIWRVLTSLARAAGPRELPAQ